jgi:hypothetical protein
VLMAGLLGLGWVFDFAVLAALSGAAVGAVSMATPQRDLPPTSLPWFLAGGLIIAVATLGVALAGGTHPQDLFNGLVLAAFRLPQVYLWPVRIGPYNVLWAAVCFAAAVAVISPSRKPRSAVTAGVVRVAAGLITWVSIILLPSSLFLVALPLAWIATRAPKGDAGRPIDSYARVLLPTLAVLESLQAYPVAGTQLSLAALLLVPVGAITLSDGIRQLHALGAEGSRTPFRLATWAAPAALLMNIAAFQLFGFLAVAAYAGGAPLGVPGAALVRVSPQRGADIRALVAATNQSCSSFITFPGMTSLYIWTGQQPPLALYAGVWMFVLDSGAQQMDVDKLEGRQRLCVVKNQAALDFWTEGRPVPSRPLVQFINTGFVSAGVYGDFELLIPR